jgi:phosphoglycolate phosphatase
MRRRAVLFDLDGTLLNTLEDLADSMNAVLRRLGLPAHEAAAYKYFVGDGIVNMARRALPADRRDEAVVTRLVEGMRRHYARHWADKTHPYDGVPELLGELTRRGLPTAVLSNKPDDSTRTMVARLLPGHRFRLVLGARPDVPIKPDPAAALEIAEALGVPPGGFVYLGDTGTDMRTATAAGMYPVGALWGFRTADELSQAGAETLIDRPAHLLKLL